jgi:hypothetical protein
LHKAGGDKKEYCVSIGIFVFGVIFERAFSAMSIIKNWLRNWMGDE